MAKITFHSKPWISFGSKPAVDGCWCAVEPVVEIKSIHVTRNPCSVYVYSEILREWMPIG